MIGAQQQPVAFSDAIVEPLLQVLHGDRLARQLVAQIGDNCVANEQLERQLMDLGAAAHVVFGRIHVAAGMETHVHAAHDLPGAAWRVVLLDHLHLELHVLREPRGRAHREILRIKLQADVDDLSKLNGHTTAPGTPVRRAQ